MSMEDIVSFIPQHGDGEYPIFVSLKGPVTLCLNTNLSLASKNMAGFNFRYLTSGDTRGHFINDRKA